MTNHLGIPVPDVKQAAGSARPYKWLQTGLTQEGLTFIARRILAAVLHGVITEKVIVLGGAAWVMAQITPC